MWNWYVVCNFHKYYLGKCTPCLNLHIYSTGKWALKIVFLVNKWLKHSGFDNINSNLWRERERGRICNWQVVESPLLCYYRGPWMSWRWTLRSGSGKLSPRWSAQVPWTTSDSSPSSSTLRSTSNPMPESIVWDWVYSKISTTKDSGFSGLTETCGVNSPHEMGRLKELDVTKSPLSISTILIIVRPIPPSYLHCFIRRSDVSSIPVLPNCVHLGFLVAVLSWSRLTKNWVNLTTFKNYFIRLQLYKSNVCYFSLVRILQFTSVEFSLIYMRFDFIILLYCNWLFFMPLNVTLCSIPLFMEIFFYSLWDYANQAIKDQNLYFND